MTKIKIALALIFSISIACVNAQVKKSAAPVKKKVVKAAPTTARKTTAKWVPAPIPGTRIKITTDSGVLIVRLYNKTPLHRDNFIKLVNDHFYDSLLFHRVINHFMIQGGDPDSKNAVAGAPLGNGGTGYTVPAEFDTTLFHKKGVLAAARDDNPAKASSGCQFYLVQGRLWTDAELNNMEMGTGIRFSPAKRAIYKTVGGTPFLDMNYTVFGEVESGLEVIDKIAAAPTSGNPYNRPLGDVHMKMEVLK